MTRSIVLFLTLITGFTGLSYEVTWQKYLAILLGAHSEATALGARPVPRRSVARVLGLRSADPASGRARSARGPPAASARGLRRGRGGHRRLLPALPALLSAAPHALDPPAGRHGPRGLRARRRARLAVDPAARDPHGRHDPDPHPGARARPRGRHPHPRLDLRVEHRGRLRRRARLGLRADPLARARRRDGRDGHDQHRGRLDPRLARPRAPRARRPRRGSGRARGRRRAVAAARALRERRAARRLRDDGLPDDRDPHGRSRLRRLRVHLRDGGRGVRALHRARQRGRVAAAARGPHAAALRHLGTRARLHRALLRARDGAVLGPPAAHGLPRRARELLRLLRRGLPRRARVDRARGAALGLAPAAALPRAQARDGRPRCARGPALQPEHRGLATRRTARRLRAALLARPAPRLPDRARRPRAGRRDHDHGTGSAAAAGRRRGRRARRDRGRRRAGRLGACLPGLGALPQPRARALELRRPLRDAAPRGELPVLHRRSELVGGRARGRRGGRSLLQPLDPRERQVRRQHARRLPDDGARGPRAGATHGIASSTPS